MIKILEFFISNLNELKPEESRLLEEGYSINYINEIYNTEYKLQKIDSKKVNTLIEDFLLNYDRSKFRIRNVFFNDTIETELINNHVIFGSIEGGYISFNEQRNFFLSYAEILKGLLPCYVKMTHNFLTYFY